MVRFNKNQIIEKLYKITDAIAFQALNKLNA